MSIMYKQSLRIDNLCNHYFLGAAMVTICVDFKVISNLSCSVLNSKITVSFYLSFRQRPSNLFLFFCTSSNISLSRSVIDGLFSIFCCIFRLLISSSCLFRPSSSMMNLFMRAISSLSSFILVAVGRYASFSFSHFEMH